MKNEIIENVTAATESGFPFLTVGMIAGAVVLGIILLRIINLILALRRVVPTNEVHIVQRSKTTVSYGQGKDANNNGNTYYEWPSWIPIIGVTKIVLPISVFKLELDSYDAYDKDRLPFEIDVVAFFRVADSNTAAQRVSTTRELQEQLIFILKGAARTILASYDINQIMIERSQFGDHFTKEVESQLEQWGVQTVKNIELMDIRDAEGNKVIQNIMAKTKSLIEMESRSVVAENMQKAQQAEIQAQREVDLQSQEAKQTVGLREAEVSKKVGIANQLANQEIKEQEKITSEKQMAIVQVTLVQQAEIDKQRGIVNAEQVKQVTILQAEGGLESKRREAEAITLEGDAKASAARAMQMAPVEAQIALAKEIGANPTYQNYLLTLRGVEAQQAVGIEQARNLGKADIKVIANGGDINSGVSSALELFTPKGGLSVGSALEAFGNTPAGKAILAKVLNVKDDINIGAEERN